MRSPPARRHAHPDADLRIAPWLIAVADAVVFVAGLCGLAVSLAPDATRAAEAPEPPAVERSTYVARTVPPLDVTTPTPQPTTSHVVPTLELQEAPGIATSAPLPDEPTSAGVSTWPERETTSVTSQTPSPTTTAPTTTTTAVTTTRPAATTSSPTTTSPPSTSAPTTSEEPTTVPTEITDFTPPGLQDDQP